MKKIKRRCNSITKRGGSVFKIIIFLIVLIINVVLAFAAPVIDFVSPTPDDADSQTATNVEINVSITEENLDKVVYNWNGMNFTTYNDSLLVMLNFDNVSDLGENSTYVIDLSQRGENISCTQCPVLNESGRYGKAYTLDGVNDIFIDSNANLNFVAAQAHTIEMWIHPFSSNSDHFFGIGSDNGVSNKYTEHMWIDGDSKIVLGLRRTWHGNWISSTSDSAVSLNEWSHIVAVNDGSDIKIYINGQLEDTDSLGSFSDYPLDDNNLEIGGYDAWSGYFNGSIDEFKLWNRSLSAEEVYQQYVSNLNKFNSTQWYLYVNQSKNATDELNLDDYTYYAWAENTSANSNETETRTITITAAAPAVVPEFPDYAVLLILITVLGSFVVIRKKG